MRHVITQNVLAVMDTPGARWLGQDKLADHASRRLDGDPEVCDFLRGLPTEPPLTPLVEGIRKHAIPLNNRWFTYTRSVPACQEIVARSLTERLGVKFLPQDISMTTGTFAGLSVMIRTLVGPGDEVLFVSPPWWFYEGMIRATGASAVKVKINFDNYDLDLVAMKNAITDKTRAVIINSPHNPTGQVVPEKTLEGLADILRSASAIQGRPIYLLSDESYHRVVFDGRRFPSPTAFYDYTCLIYTYAKQFLAPGERIGFIALPDRMPDRQELWRAIILMQLINGYDFPNVVLQYALPELENVSIDLDLFQKKRDRLCQAMSEMGYKVRPPQATLFFMIKSPWENDLAFVELLNERKVLTLPGQAVDMPGYFRMSLTANMEMIERALPRLKKSLEYAENNPSPGLSNVIHQ